MSSCENHPACSVSDLLVYLENGLRSEDPASAVTEQQLQQLFGAAVKFYAAKREVGEPFSPVATESPWSVTATEGVVASSALLKAINVEVFELGMWQSWGKL